eukprot:508361-Hanusia_phi.AAC.1
MADRVRSQCSTFAARQAFLSWQCLISRKEHLRRVGGMLMARRVRDTSMSSLRAWERYRTKCKYVRDASLRRAKQLISLSLVEWQSVTPSALIPLKTAARMLNYNVVVPSPDLFLSTRCPLQYFNTTMSFKAFRLLKVYAYIFAVVERLSEATEVSTDEKFLSKMKFLLLSQRQETSHSRKKDGEELNHDDQQEQQQQENDDKEKEERQLNAQRARAMWSMLEKSEEKKGKQCVCVEKACVEKVTDVFSLIEKFERLTRSSKFGLLARSLFLWRNVVEEEEKRRDHIAEFRARAIRAKDVRCVSGSFASFRECRGERARRRNVSVRIEHKRKEQEMRFYLLSWKDMTNVQCQSRQQATTRCAVVANSTGRIQQTADCIHRLLRFLRAWQGSIEIERYLAEKTKIAAGRITKGKKKSTMCCWQAEAIRSKMLKRAVSVISSKRKKRTTDEVVRRWNLLADVCFFQRANITQRSWRWERSLVEDMFAEWKIFCSKMLGMMRIRQEVPMWRQVALTTQTFHAWLSVAEHNKLRDIGVKGLQERTRSLLRHASWRGWCEVYRAQQVRKGYIVRFKIRWIILNLQTVLNRWRHSYSASTSLRDCLQTISDNHRRLLLLQLCQFWSFWALRRSGRRSLVSQFLQSKRAERLSQVIIAWNEIVNGKKHIHHIEYHLTLGWFAHILIHHWKIWQNRIEHSKLLQLSFVISAQRRSQRRTRLTIVAQWKLLVRCNSPLFIAARQTAFLCGKRTHFRKQRVLFCLTILREWTLHCEQKNFGEFCRDSLAVSEQVSCQHVRRAQQSLKDLILHWSKVCRRKLHVGQREKCLLRRIQDVFGRWRSCSESRKRTRRTRQKATMSASSLLVHNTFHLWLDQHSAQKARNTKVARKIVRHRLGCEERAMEGWAQLSEGRKRSKLLIQKMREKSSVNAIRRCFNCFQDGLDRMIEAEKFGERLRTIHAHRHKTSALSSWSTFTQARRARRDPAVREQSKLSRPHSRLLAASECGRPPAPQLLQNVIRIQRLQFLLLHWQVLVLETQHARREKTSSITRGISLAEKI